jgi:hypothetical protein
MKRRQWVRLLFENRGPILNLIHQALEIRFWPQADEPLSIETQETVQGPA